MNTAKKPLLGAHVSAARSAGSGQSGLVNAIDNGERIGAECIQIFGASPRSYAAALPSNDAVLEFKERLAKSSIRAVYQHGAYLVNLASSDDETLAKSIANLAAHLQIANLIGSKGVVFHVGSPRSAGSGQASGGDRKEALARAASAMKQVLKKVDASGPSAGSGQAQLIMENSGSIKKIGGSFDDLAFLFKEVADPRVKICIDTAHALESGMIESYTPAHIKEFFDTWDKLVGLEHIVAIHANDSKTPYNSQNDKHENIGEGHIGIEGFRALAREKRLAHTCWFLEVPGFDEMGPDKENVDRLKSCFI